MKIALIITISLLSTSAFASKARVNSLLGANHLIDTQTIFTAPSHIHELDPYLTYEMGATSNTAAAKAEGGFLRELDNGNRILVYLGHQNTTASNNGFTGDLRNYTTGTPYIRQNNPIEIIYGRGNMAFGASLSNVTNDNSNTKETTLIGKWGMNLGSKGWTYAHLTLISNAEKRSGANTSNDEMKVFPYLTLGGSYKYRRGMRVYGELDYGSAEESFPGISATTDYDDLNLQLGFENQFVRTSDADIYYGIALQMNKRSADVGANKYDAESTTLPAYLGIEYRANDWATVRASVRQNILFGDKKDEIVATASTKKDGIATDTVVAAGLGLKYKDITLDGSLTAAADGDVNGNTFLSQASLTYNF